MKELEEKRNQIKIEEKKKARILLNAKEDEIVQLNEEIKIISEKINSLQSDSNKEGSVKRKNLNL